MARSSSRARAISSRVRPMTLRAENRGRGLAEGAGLDVLAEGGDAPVLDASDRR
jgi:hypothetical protein